MTGKLQIDKARVHRLYEAIVLGVQLLHHRLGDFDRGAVVLLGGGEGTVALVFAQVGTVGNRHPAVRAVIARFFKGRLHFLGNDIQNLFHQAFSFFSAIQAR